MLIGCGEGVAGGLSQSAGGMRRCDGMWATVAADAVKKVHEHNRIFPINIAVSHNVASIYICWHFTVCVFLVIIMLENNHVNGIFAKAKTNSCPVRATLSVQATTDYMGPETFITTAVIKSVTFYNQPSLFNDLVR